MPFSQDLSRVIDPVTVEINNVGFATELGDAPETVDDLYARYRADVNIVKNSSDLVGVWRDLTANAHDLVQYHNSYKPKYYASQINGHPSIRGFYDGAATTTLTTANTFGLTGAFTIFMVSKSNDTTTDARSAIPMVFGTTNLSHYHAFYHPRSAIPAAHRFEKYTGSGIISSSASPSGAMNAWKYLTWYGDATSNGYYYNGSLVSQTYTIGSSSTDGTVSQTVMMAIFGTPVQSQIFNGEFAEIIIYNRKLNDTERGTVEAYLASRYGL